MKSNKNKAQVSLEFIVILAIVILVFAVMGFEKISVYIPIHITNYNQFGGFTHE